MSLSGSGTEVCKCNRCPDAFDCFCSTRTKPMTFVGLNATGLMFRIIAIIGVGKMYKSADHLHCIHKTSVDDVDDVLTYNNITNTTTPVDDEDDAVVDNRKYKGPNDDLIDWAELCKYSSADRLQNALYMMIWILCLELFLNACAMFVYRTVFFSRDAAGVETDEAGNPYDANYSPVEQGGSVIEGEKIEGFKSPQTQQPGQPSWMAEEGDNSAAAPPGATNASANPSWV